MFGIADKSVFQSFEEEEISDPCPRKVREDGTIVYTSRQLDFLKNGLHLSSVTLAQRYLEKSNTGRTSNLTYTEHQK